MGEYINNNHYHLIMNIIKKAKVRYMTVPANMIEELDTSEYPYKPKKKNTCYNKVTFLGLTIPTTIPQPNKINLWIRFEGYGDGVIRFKGIRFDGGVTEENRDFIENIKHEIEYIMDTKTEYVLDKDVIVNVLKTIYSISCIGLPLTAELVSVYLLKKGLTKDIIVNYNMIIRGILYKLKQLLFNVAVDDEQYDSNEHIEFICDAYTAINECIEDIFNDIKRACESNGVDVQQLLIYGELIKTTIKDLYTTGGICEKYRIGEFRDLIKEDLRKNCSEYVQPITAISNTMRSIMVNLD